MTRNHGARECQGPEPKRAKSMNSQGISELCSLHIGVTVTQPGGQNLNEHFSLAGLLQFHIFEGEMLVGVFENSNSACFGKSRRHFYGMI